MGISKYEGPHATAAAASTAPIAARLRLLAARVLSGRAIIDFLKEVKILPNLDIVRLEFERFFVGLACFVQLSLVLLADCEIVEGRCVGGVDLDRLLPAVNRLPPQSALRDGDSEGYLLFRVAPRVGVGGNRRE